MNVSVALCVWNGALFLAEQLQSIAQQTRRPDEVVIGDDGSTDGSVEIVRTVAERTGLHCLIHQNETRLGVEQNFSQAMQKTSGDVIFFCDQDDVWAPEKVAKMIAPFQADPQVALVYSDGAIVGPQLESTGVTLFTKNPQKRLADGDRRDVGALLCTGHAPGIKASSFAFAAGVRDLAGPLPEGIAHDGWIALFGYAAGQVVAINEPLYSYRRHAQTSGASSTNALIPGLQRPPKHAPGDFLRDKAHFAECVYARMCAIEQEFHSSRTLRARFYTLKAAAQCAAGSLHARAAVRENSGALRRFMQGSLALLTGKYAAIPGTGQQLRLWYQDIRRPQA